MLEFYGELKLSISQNGESEPCIYGLCMDSVIYLWWSHILTLENKHLNMISLLHIHIFT